MRRKSERTPTDIRPTPAKEWRRERREVPELEEARIAALWVEQRWPEFVEELEILTLLATPDARVRRDALDRVSKRLPPRIGLRCAPEQLQAAALLVVLQGEEPQFVRMGSKWVTDHAGRRELMVPLHDLTLVELRRWFRQQAAAAARAEARGEPYPVRPDDKLQPRRIKPGKRPTVHPNRELEKRTRQLAMANENPVLRLLEETDWVRAFFAGLAPRQQQVVRLLLDGQNRNEVARLLGVSRSTVDNTILAVQRRIPPDLHRPKKRAKKKIE